jgi:hypothetical protein
MVDNRTLESWYLHSHLVPGHKSAGWDMGVGVGIGEGVMGVEGEKEEQMPMLPFDDLIEKHAFDEYVLHIAI